ncbi:MAG TPA: response regulator [Sulfurimonas sp. UBA12504]|nr:MAG: histidine kinase [Sulfurimonas sp. GWF2_37_8]DAB29809.1 MAG TPA: response regulator [Sulfurimonas sp. UBA12504]
MVAKKAIEEAGHEAVLVENGAEGLEAMKEHQFDLIFSDVNMPILGGLDMVKAIKEIRAYKHIPIVMLTTESSNELKEQGKALGVKAWMLKPFDKEKFMMVVQKLIG